MAGQGKSRPPSPLQGIFCSFFVLHPHLFVLIVLAFAFFPYCTTNTTQTSMSRAGFEPATPASDRPQTAALDRSATGIDNSVPRPSSSQRVALPTELSRPTTSTKYRYVLFITECTRWFKYDRDKLRLVYTQIVPVIFEPPCTTDLHNDSRQTQRTS